MEKNQKEELFKYLKYLVIILTLLIIYSIFWGPAAKFSASLAPIRTIYVSGQGKVVVEPEFALVSLGVVTEGQYAKNVQEENNKKIEGIIKYLKEDVGIDEKDIKTTQYYLAPKYSSAYSVSSYYYEGSRESKIIGFTLTQQISVKIKDIKKTGEIVGKLAGLGVNNVNSISFDVEDREKYLSEAREKAFAEALEKAKAMAAQNKTRIKGVVTFSESSYPYYPTAYKSSALGMGGAVEDSSYAPIESGSQEITSNVSVTYEIK